LQKEACFDGERVTEEVGEARDGREHCAFHELPRFIERLAQVLLVVVIHLTPL
jgi:NTP pyrophosphatase (non-canonical NTP hydrolase)